MSAIDAAAVLDQATPEAARGLVALLSGSQVLGEWLVRQPDWLPRLLDTEGLRPPRTEAGPAAGRVEAWKARAPAAQRYEETGPSGAITAMRTKQNPG